MRPLVVGTRGSQLAVTQTNWVINELKKIRSDLDIETKIIVTKGDLLQKTNIPLSKIGGKGLFLKEIERELLNGTIDFAVHSMKDVPAEMPAGLIIGCTPTRVDARDALIAKQGLSLAQLPTGSVVGTSSLRRQAQLLAYRPDLVVEPIRGNIDSRLRKMQEGSYDATVLATAGLVRMGWTEQITERISVDVMTPAIGQGALVVECRDNDAEVYTLLQQIHDLQTARATTAERAFQKVFQGGCHLPIAAHAEVIKGQIELTGMVADPEGTEVVQGTITGVAEELIGARLGQQLMAKGAGEIIGRVNRMLKNALQNS